MGIGKQNDKRLSASAYLIAALLVCVLAATTVVWGHAEIAYAPNDDQSRAKITAEPARLFPQQGVGNQLATQFSNGAGETGFRQAQTWAQPRYSAPIRAQRKCSVSNKVGKLPGTASVTVADAGSGETLYKHGPGKLLEPASVMKLVTASSVLFTFGPDARLQTRVVVGKRKSDITLVGGGDPTLTTSKKNRYGAVAPLKILASEVKAWAKVNHVKIKRVNYDDSLFNGGVRKEWGKNIYQDGYITRIRSLMIDAGRIDRDSEYSQRSTDPSKMAAKAFAVRLGKHVKVKHKKQGKSDKVIAVVSSPKISKLVKVMLRQSDNVLAESLGRLAAIDWGYGNTFASIGKLNAHILGTLGVKLDGDKLKDGSGFGADNRLSSATIVALLQRMNSVTSPISVIPTYLAASGRSGTLKDRFTGNAKVPKDSVKAKTGTLGGVGAMAGIVTSGHSKLVFAVLVNGKFSLDAPKPAIDAVVSRLHACGSGLSGGK